MYCLYVLYGTRIAIQQTIQSKETIGLRKNLINTKRNKQKTNYQRYIKQYNENWPTICFDIHKYKYNNKYDNKYIILIIKLSYKS